MRNGSVSWFIRHMTSQGGSAILILLALLVWNQTTAQSAVVINEFVSSNYAILEDEDGEFEDWIELYNTGNESIVLDGWGITDDLNRPFLWTLPAVTINPQEFLVLFASGKDRDRFTDPNWHINHTNSVAGAWLFREQSGTSAADESVNNVTGTLNAFVDWTWRHEWAGALDIPLTGSVSLQQSVELSGDFTVSYWFWTRRTRNWRLLNNSGSLNYSVGHWDVNRIGLFNPNTEIHLNQHFALDQWEHFVLTRSGTTVTVYRNGFPAGTGDWAGTIRPDRIGGTSGGTAWSSFDGKASDILLLNQAMTEADVLELHLQQRVNYLHTNFRISSDGEWLQLTRPDGPIADQLPPVNLPGELSYGRQPDGGPDWFYFEQPTPGTSNNTSGYSTLVTPPSFSIPGGFYTNDLQVTLMHPDPDAILIYTLDGSIPDIDNLGGTTYSYKNQYPYDPGDPFGDFLYQSFQSLLYTNPISITDRSPEPDRLTQISTTKDFAPDYFPESPVRKGTVIRARAYVDGTLSPVHSIRQHTYFILPEGNPYSLPLVSLGIQENHLFDYEQGIYVAGIDFDEWRQVNQVDEANWTRPQNSNRRGREWEIPAHVELFEVDRPEAVLNQGAGIRIHGGGSRRLRLKNFRLYARNQYDARNEFDHQLFDHSVPFATNPDNEIYRRLVFRSHNYIERFAIELFQPLFEGIPRSRPAIHFINGEYWGITSIRDRFDEHHLANHYQLDPNNIVILDAPFGEGQERHIDVGYVADLELYRSMYHYIVDHDLSISSNYHHVVNTLLDIRSYVDFQILRMYLTDYDWWGVRHFGFWRVREPSDDHFGDGRWRAFTWDFDGAASPARINMDLLHMAINGWASDRTDIFRNLLESDEFRFYFINRFADHMNTVFRPAHIEETIHRVYGEIEDYLPESIHRWDMEVARPSRNNAHIGYAQQRPPIQRQHIRTQFGIEGDIEVTLSIADASVGFIEINTIQIHEDTPGVPAPVYPWTGLYFSDIPITLQAHAEPGHRFASWHLNGSDDVFSTDDELILTLSADTSIEARFEPIPLAELPLQIHAWDFESTEQPFAPAYTLGGAILQVEDGPDSEDELDIGGDFDTQHLRINDPIGAALVLHLPTTNYESIELSYWTRRSGQGPGEHTLSYTTNGVDWVEWQSYVVLNAPPQYHLWDLSTILGSADNPDFGIRITFREGLGGTSGNTRFDDIRLVGVGMPGVNVPPMVQAEPEDLFLIAGEAPIQIDLNQVFVDPNGYPLSFTATSSVSTVVSVEIDDDSLLLTPVQQGESWITLGADDASNPEVTTSFRVLVYPAAHPLAGAPFTFAEWLDTQPAHTYPDHMLFLQGQHDDSALDAELLHAYHIPSFDAALPQDSDFPYAALNRTRINGLGEEGISFINTGRGRDLGGALLALDTRGVTAAPVSWLAGTLLANSREYALRLQYRVGTTGVFLDVLDADEQPVEYRRQVDGDIQPMPPVLLPEESLGQEYVQLLWRYYFVSGDEGPRAQLRLDEIFVGNTAPSPASHLEFTDSLRSSWQSGQTLLPFTIHALDEQGVLDPDFAAPVTVSVSGDGSVSGTTTVAAESGVAVFTNVAIHGAGEYVVSAQAEDLQSATSSPVRVVSVSGHDVPLYIQGDQPENNDRVPFVYRARIEGLLPNATYRYGNRVIDESDPWDQDGGGNMIFVTGADTDWIRNTDSPRFRGTDVGGRHWTFTTDAEGAYEGWFVTEPTGNRRFEPGGTLFMRILLNDGQGGEEREHYLTLPDPVTVIRFGSNPDEASGITSSTVSPARNLVFLYDQDSGTGRPLAGVPVERTGSELDDRYVGFYEHVLSDAWAALIPNYLTGGIQRVETRSLIDNQVLLSSRFDQGIPGTIELASGSTPLSVEVRPAPTDFSVWRQIHFDAVELADETISGALADPDDSGVPNLLRYALGMGREEPVTEHLPFVGAGEGKALFSYYRLRHPDAGLVYVIEVSESLVDSDAWRSAVMESDLIERSVQPEADGVTEVIEYEVPTDTLSEPKYFRLRIHAL